MLIGSPEAIHPPSTLPTRPISRLVRAPSAALREAMAALGSTVAALGGVTQNGIPDSPLYQPPKNPPTPIAANRTNIGTANSQTMDPWSALLSARCVPAIF